MLDFLRHILRNESATYTVLIVNRDSLDDPTQYTVQPRQLRNAAIGTVAGAMLFVFLLFALTPIIELIPGRSMADVRASARMNAVRIARLQDSLQVQDDYISQLVTVVGGGEINFEAIDDAPASGLSETGDSAPLEGAYIEAGEASEDWQSHSQPALPVSRMPAFSYASVNPEEASRGYLTSLRLPFMAPVNGGVMTRGFNAQIGHYGIDVAVPQETAVRSIGEGFVVLADWTYGSGYVIAVQHADGYVTVYKHNSRLLKRVGDKVGERETIALSGNSGQTSSGPHIHFELWHEGLAQDPQYYLFNL
ncbi:MAG: M23 family metallopeptidase [Bacteroidota bacterium]